MRLLFFLVLFQFSVFQPIYADSSYSPQSVGTTQGGSDIGEYEYDSASNRIKKTDGENKVQSVEYNLLSKPAKITTDSKIEEFRYGVGGKRYMRKHADVGNVIEGDANKVIKTLYVGNLEYRVYEGGTAKSVYRISAGGYSTVAKTTVMEGGPEYEYHLTDHLGSTLMAVKENGNVVSNSLRRFDPFGMPSNAQGVSITQQEERRGFTGHENIASAKLIHMNGRVFDHEIALFLSPDKLLKDGLNRFAYVKNSPLGKTDPSGWGSRRALNLAHPEFRALHTFVHSGSNGNELYRGHNPRTQELASETSFRLWHQVASDFAEDPLNSSFVGVDPQTPGLHLFLEHLDSAIRNISTHFNPTGRPMTTYHGVKSNRLANLMRRINIGESYRLNRYLSTADELDYAAEEFAIGGSDFQRSINGGPVTNYSGVALEVTGTSGAPIARLPDFSGETETLYSRNTSFEVTHFKTHSQDGENIFVVGLRETNHTRAPSPEPSLDGNRSIGSFDVDEGFPQSLSGIQD